MRLAIISDIHGNLLALETVLADIATRGVDATVNLGDCATGPLWPRETVELLDALALPTVRGNHDRWIAALPPEHLTPTVSLTRDALTSAQREALGALPPTLEIYDEVFAVHGTPSSDTDYLLEDAVDGRLARVAASTLAARLDGCSASLVLCGHSHVQHSAHASANCLVVNPGSVGCPRYVDSADASTCEAGSPHARYAIATRLGARWTVELFALSYDWSEVAERARANGFTRWAANFLL